MNGTRSRTNETTHRIETEKRKTNKAYRLREHEKKDEEKKNSSESMGKLFHLYIMWMCRSRGGDSASSSTEWLISCGCLSVSLAAVGIVVIMSRSFARPLIFRLVSSFFLLSLFSFLLSFSRHFPSLRCCIAAVGRILYSPPILFSRCSFCFH